MIPFGEEPITVQLSKTLVVEILVPISKSLGLSVEPFDIGDLAGVIVGQLKEESVIPFFNDDDGGSFEQLDGSLRAVTESDICRFTRNIVVEEASISEMGYLLFINTPSPRI